MTTLPPASRLNKELVRRFQDTMNSGYEAHISRTLHELVAVETWGVVDVLSQMRQLGITFA